MKTKNYLRTLVKLSIPAFYFLLICSSLNAQNTFPNNGSAGIGTTSPNSSSLLEMVSTSKGLLIPRMTKNQRDNISSPATGLLIYQTNNTPGFYYYDGSNWTAVTPKNKSWSLTGNAGTDSSINFVGTTDAHPLTFRVNNQKSGWIDYTGNNNTSFGYQGLLVNTTGSGNTASGYQSLYNNTTGSNNIAIGYVALYNNITGSLNVAIGHAASYQTTGSGNTSVGEFALSTNSTGSYNTALGISSGPNSEDLSFTTAIGYGASTSSSNQVRIGSIGFSGDPTSIGGKVGWSTLSDGRVKKNIKENVPGLAFINKLKPITYNLDNEAVNKIVQHPAIKDKDGKEIKPSTNELAAANANTTIIYTGFVAQDVEKAAKSLNYNFSGVDAAKNDKDLYGLRYAEFVVPLVKAVQELSKMNDDKNDVISSQQKEIIDLKERMTTIEAMLKMSNTNNLSNNSSVSLSQNIPNPFSNSTTIEYTLPQKFTQAKIIITDNSGKAIKAINISQPGKCSLHIDAATFASGAYNYSLIIDGKLISSKQMILAK